MADAASEDALRRELEAHERRTDAIHQELGARITQVARDMLPLAVWQQFQQTWSDTVKRLEREQDTEIQRLEREHDAEMQRLEREHARDITEVRAELKELRERPQLTTGRLAVIGTAVIAALALVVQAYGVLKGAHS